MRKATRWFALSSDRKEQLYNSVMKYRVEVGEGREKFSVYYDDYGNAAECAQAYREQGFKVVITEQ